MPPERSASHRRNSISDADMERLQSRWFESTSCTSAYRSETFSSTGSQVSCSF